MNILQQEDMVKSYPDQQLIQEAQQPTGQIPTFLVMSELQRRQKMRQSFANSNAEFPDGTIKDQLVNTGIAAHQQQQAMAQSQQPVRRMAAGGLTSGYGSMIMTIPVGNAQHVISYAGYPSQQAAYEAWLNGDNESLRVDEGLERNDRGGIVSNSIPTPGPFPQYQDEMKVRFDANGNMIREPDPLQFSLNTLSPEVATPDIPDRAGPVYDQFPVGVTTEEAPETSLFPWKRRRLGAFPADEVEQPSATARPEVSEKIADWWGPRLKDFGGHVARTFGFGSPEEEGGIAAVGNVTAGGMIDQTEAEGIEALMAEQVAEDPSLLYQVPSAENKDDPLAQGHSEIQMQGTGSPESALAQLMALTDRKYPERPKFDDIVAEQKQDTFWNSIAAIGGGIAGDDLSGGINRAVALSQRGREQARELETKSRILDYSTQQGEVDRDIQILGKAGVVEAAMVRAQADKLIESGRTARAALQFIESQIKTQVEGIMWLPQDGKTGEERKAAFMAALRRQMISPELRERMLLEGMLEGNQGGPELEADSTAVDWNDIPDGL